MDQTVINWILAALSGAIGFFLRAMWETVKDLQKADKDLAEKVGGIEVLVAGAYVTKDEHTRVLHALFSKLDRIEDKLDSKADKTSCPTRGA